MKKRFAYGTTSFQSIIKSIFSGHVTVKEIFISGKYIYTCIYIYIHVYN